MAGFSLRSLILSLAGTVAIAGSLLPREANAFPLTSTRPWNSVNFMLTEPGFDHDGIVAMSNCSASFVRFANSSDDAKGLLLTNGHCVGGTSGFSLLRPGEYLYQKARRFTVSLLDRNASRIATLRSEKIVYATMTGTDLAILELTQTYRQIRQATGVEALVIADSHPTSGTEIQVPSGYWERTYSCQIEAFAHTLKEGDWTFSDSIRYSPTGCEVIGGTSGSPIVASRTGQIIGINNTGNEGATDCRINNPCEIDENGQKNVYKNRGYGQQTFWLHSCRNAQGDIDLAVSGCKLFH